MSFTWIFQGGRRVIKTISNTAGNVLTTLSPGSGKRWLVLMGTIRLQTDATTADRSIILRVKDSSNNLLTTLFRSDSQTASTDSYYYFGPTKYVGSNMDAVTRIAGIDPILLDENDKLVIEISNGQAGDTYSGHIVILEVDM